MSIFRTGKIVLHQGNENTVSHWKHLCTRVYKQCHESQGDSLTLGMGVLMCLFGVGEIIWGLKFLGPKLLSVV